VQRQYGGPNIVVTVAGPVRLDAVARDAQAAFGAAPAMAPNTIAEPVFGGGIRSKAMPGSSQSHLVMGFAVPGQQAGDVTAAVAATLFGEGMSSPLLGELREKRGLVYYAAASADVLDAGGQFVVEASTSPAQLDECVAELARLLARQAEHISAVDLERAHNQLLVRRLRALEEPARRLESAALDLFIHGRVRSLAEWRAAIAAAGAEPVRALFQRMLQAGPAVAVTCKLPRGLRERVRTLLAAQGLRCA
jgi:predicted Zn-dependent peptidase